MTDKKPKPALTHDSPQRKHKNPEMVPHPLVTPTTFDSGVVYKTSAIPPMTVRVIGAATHVRIPEDDHGPAGEFTEGDEFKTDGPTAHMLEARGIVEIIEEHA